MIDREGDESSVTARTLNRRSYLRAATGVAALVGAGVGTAAADAGYDVIDVPAGQRYDVRLGDGDTLENVLIDVTARGASYDIVCSGSGWAVRNLGVVGKTYNNRFNARVPDPNGSAVIENVYLSGSPGTSRIESDGESGIFVYPNHAGDLLIRNAYVQDCNDNGIYGSPPGNSSDHPWPGSNGTVRVENVYAVGNHTAGIRLGTDGSYADNCVMHGGFQRGYWGFYNDTELVDCDIFDNASADVHAGSGTWNAGNDCSATVENCRFESVTTAPASNEVVGESVGEPEHRIPEGAPASPEEAASGGGSS